MKVQYTIDARQHIAEIGVYISRRNTLAAAQVVARIRAKVALLGRFPHVGRSGKAPGTYETTVKGLPCIIVYEIHAKVREVWILGIFHGAQGR